MSHRCPACGRDVFRALMPLWSYEPRRWLLWLPPRKRFLGDLAQCVNPACNVVSVAGTAGMERMSPKPPPPEPPPDGGEVNGVPQAGAKPDPKRASQIYDSDLRWR